MARKEHGNPILRQLIKEHSSEAMDTSRCYKCFRVIRF